MKAAFDSLAKSSHGPLSFLWDWFPWRPAGTGRKRAWGGRRLVEAFDVSDRPTVGLALSSGGAKGLAHIGVIQVLEENGIKVDAVAGTSMGAYVGAMWSSGLNGEELEELAATVRTKKDLWSLVDPVLFPRRGFIRGRKIESRLRDTLGERSFEELEKPLYVIATEFAGFRRKVIHQGDVASAVLASLAIPGIVVPVNRDGIEYVDGGVCDPLPVRVLLEDAGVDHVVAVNVLPTVEEFDESRRIKPDCPKLALWKRPFCWLNRKINWFARGNLLDTLRSAAMASQMQVVEHSSRMADVTLRPVDVAVRWHDYTNHRRYIEIGREAALRALPDILALTRGESVSQTSETQSVAATS